MKRLQIKNDFASSSAEMYLFGTIGDDLNAAAFVQELKDLAATNGTIIVHVNSGGGSVFDGLAIFGALKECSSKVIGKIDGICASMATVVCCAMDEIQMSSAGKYMTHKPSGWVSGNSADMKIYAGVMDDLENVIAGIYAAKTGLTAEQAKAKFLQSEDNWLSPKQALDAKLIDSIFDIVEDAAPPLPATLKTEKEIMAFFASHLQKFNLDMKQFTMTAGQLSSLGLKPDADPIALATALDNLVAKAAKVDSMQTQLDNAVTAKNNAETELANMKKSTVTARVDSLLAQGKADKKLTVEMANGLKAQFPENPDGLEAVLKIMPPLGNLVKNLKTVGEVKDESEGKTWEQLDKIKGALDRLKAKDPDRFKALYQESFGKEYVG